MPVTLLWQHKQQQHVADISSNCRPTLFDGRPITVSVIEVSHAHKPSMCPSGVVWLTDQQRNRLLLTVRWCVGDVLLTDRCQQVCTASELIPERLHSGLYWSWGWCWWRWWQLEYEMYKAWVKSSSPTTNQQPGRPDALPDTQPTVSKHWVEKYHVPWTCSPSSLGVFQHCLWALEAPCYLGGGLPSFSSALWCQHPVLLVILIRS